ncbi:multidrug ABC transporter ATP-binding protein [Aliifodinibius salipaludis]|uniref:Multidrug ABC transporter ATP-binding protein n=1 Tax=Fodinibius salipaludis TaxID=2032627 RepID=A0A2A2GAZ8_9BACT|nr:ABC transporter ATP-binding protein [Aliifodinibius salipaludis]PAU94015.1 multidrug ABC transporter ATP-binding protein [Aliifodinibius salipaludis]
MLVAAVLEVAGIGMIPAFVAIVADPDRVLDVEWLQPLLAMLDITDSKGLLIWGSSALVGIFIIKGAYIITFNYFEARFIFNRRYTICFRLMRSYMQAPYIFHLRRNTAELLRNISQEINVLTNNVITTILKMGREGVVALAILIFLFTMEPLITLLVISLSGFGAGTFIALNKKKMKEYGEEEQLRRMEMIKAVNQGLGGIKDARVLNRENEFIEKFRFEAYRSTRLMAHLRFIQQIPRPVVETTAVLGMLLIAVLMVWQGRPIEAIIPILTLFAMATVRLMPSVQQLVTMYTQLRYNIVSLDPIYNDLKELSEHNTQFVKDRDSTHKLQLRKEIVINDVSYSYPGSEIEALSDISITIPKGQAIAFVGASGAGKTTMVDLILGLLDPKQGQILVDGTDISNNLSAWQKNIGYIPQSIYLADETLRANIAFGLPKDDIDEEKIQNAVELAQLDTMVQGLPEGLDAEIGEHGTRLSGGQRQRVGIARALYHEPDVLVMDEATSALDNITEKLITEAIESLKGERTLIMIAHRLTTVKNCDKLYFMEEGKIIQEGTYEDLVDTNIRFREMALEA